MEPTLNKQAVTYSQLLGGLEASPREQRSKTQDQGQATDSCRISPLASFQIHAGRGQGLEQGQVPGSIPAIGGGKQNLNRVLQWLLPWLPPSVLLPTVAQLPACTT